MEHVPEPGRCWEVHTVVIPQASVVHVKAAVQENGTALQYSFTHGRGIGKVEGFIPEKIVRNTRQL